MKKKHLIFSNKLSNPPENMASTNRNVPMKAYLKMYSANTTLSHSLLHPYNNYSLITLVILKLCYYTYKTLNFFLSVPTVSDWIWSRHHGEQRRHCGHCEIQIQLDIWSKNSFSCIRSIQQCTITPLLCFFKLTELTVTMFSCAMSHKVALVILTLCC